MSIRISQTRLRWVQSAIMTFPPCTVLPFRTCQQDSPQVEQLRAAPVLLPPPRSQRQHSSSSSQVGRPRAQYLTKSKTRDCTAASLQRRVSHFCVPSIQHPPTPPLFLSVPLSLSLCVLVSLSATHHRSALLTSYSKSSKRER